MAKHIVRNKNKKGIAFEIQSKIGISVISVLLFVAVLVVIIVYKSLVSANNIELQQNSEVAALQIERYFAPFERMVEQQAHNRTYKELLTATSAGQSLSTSTAYASAMQDMLAAQQLDSSHILSTWIADVDSGSLILSDGYVSGSDLDITTREWYECVSTKETMMTTPYTDISTGKMIMSISTPVYDNNKNVIGISGMDIDIDNIISLMKDYTIGESGYTMLISSGGTFVYHPNDTYVNTAVRDAHITDNLIEAIENHETAFVRYKLNGEARYGYTIPVGDTGFLILSCIPSGQYYSTLVTIVCTLVVIFVVGFVSILLSMKKTAESIVKPLSHLNESALQLASGNLSVTIEADSKDEVGDLGRSIHQTVTRLKEYINYINEISEVLTAMADGKLSIELQYAYAGEFQKVKEALYHISDSMNSIIKNIAQSAEQVSIGSDDLAKAAHGMSESSEAQAAAVEELLATTTTVAEQVRENKNDSEKSAAYTEEVAEVMETSKQQMSAMQEAMDNIQKASSKVVGVIKTIEDIAEQTNLLSLNASIEAARAGEAGRGFAVVAGEIGGLANESAAAVQTTRDLIGVSLQEIEKGNALVKDVVSSLNLAVDKVEIANGMIQNNAKTAEIQMQSVGQIRDGVEEISQGIQDNSAVAEQTSATSEELAAQAVTLNGLVKKFQLK